MRDTICDPRQTMNDRAVRGRSFDTRWNWKRAIRLTEADQPTHEPGPSDDLGLPEIASAIRARRRGEWHLIGCISPRRGAGEQHALPSPTCGVGRRSLSRTTSSVSCTRNAFVTLVAIAVARISAVSIGWAMTILDGDDRSVPYALALLGRRLLWASQRAQFLIGQVFPAPHHAQIRGLNRPAVAVGQ
jgi:hypothetical protein